MNVVVYLTLFFIPTLFFIKYYKDYRLTKIKYEIIETIDIINSLDRKRLEENKKSYPEFYKVIKSIFSKEYDLLLFEHVEKSARVVEKQISGKINEEINNISDKAEGIYEFTLLYRKLCILMYLYKNFNKYLIVEFLIKILPEKGRKEIEEKEKEKASDLCLA
jgi:hypothetical protein